VEAVSEARGTAPIVRAAGVDDFEDIPEGMRYKVTMTIGSTAPLLRTVTRLVRERLLAQTLDAWHLHNVQEVGNLPHFLPDLYAAHAGKNP